MVNYFQNLSCIQLNQPGVCKEITSLHWFILIGLLVTLTDMNSD